MKFKRTFSRSRITFANTRGFTLAEVLAALVFMAIVIPVAVQGIRIAARAGEVAERKAAAARVAERVLNEAIVTGQASQSSQRGTIREGHAEYQWQLRNEAWNREALRVLSVQVFFTAQGIEHEVKLSTLWDSSSASGSSGITTR